MDELKIGKTAKVAIAGGIIATGCLALPGCVPAGNQTGEPVNKVNVPTGVARYATVYGPAEPMYSLVAGHLDNGEFSEVYSPAESFTGEPGDEDDENDVGNGNNNSSTDAESGEELVDL